MRNKPIPQVIYTTNGSRDWWTWRVVNQRGRVLAEPDPDDTNSQYIGPWGEDFAIDRARREALKLEGWHNV